MASGVLAVICGLTILVQSISTQSIGHAYGAPFNPVGAYGLNAASPSSGGGFLVKSTSPIHPTGIAVFSENIIEGPISIDGKLPFLGAIAMEGSLPTLGAGGINYGCGDGAIGIVSEGIGSAAAVGPSRYGTAAHGWVPPVLGLSDAGLGFHRLPF